METFTEFVRTTECLALVKRVFGTRELPPCIAAVLNGQYERDDSPNGALGQFIERIRAEGIAVRGFDHEAHKAAAQIIFRAQF